MKWFETDSSNVLIPLFSNMRIRNKKKRAKSSRNSLSWHEINARSLEACVMTERLVRKTRYRLHSCSSRLWKYRYLSTEDLIPIHFYVAIIICPVSHIDGGKLYPIIAQWLVGFPSLVEESESIPLITIIYNLQEPEEEVKFLYNDRRPRERTGCTQPCPPSSYVPWLQSLHFWLRIWLE